MKKPELCIGVYDMLSALLAAQYSDSIFVSGYGLAASYLGLPDIGLITTDIMVDFVSRLRTLLPSHKIIVDLDDGYGDVKIAKLAAKKAEQAGADLLILEDQARPKKCGHLSGKNILPVDTYLAKYTNVVSSVSIPVVARTDEEDILNASKRAKLFFTAGANHILVDGLKTKEEIITVRSSVPNATLYLNLIAGGKTCELSYNDIHELGIDKIILSTPCLSAAFQGIQNHLEYLVTSHELNSLYPQISSMSDINSILDKAYEKVFQ